MIGIVVVLDQTVSLTRLDEVAGLLDQKGMTVNHIIKSLNLITGTIDDRHLLAEFHNIQDVQSIVIK